MPVVLHLALLSLLQLATTRHTSDPRAHALLTPNKLTNKPRNTPQPAMINLFGNTGNAHLQIHTQHLTPTSHLDFFTTHNFAEESKKQRNALSLRDAPAGSRKVQFRKPPSATDGLTLGLKFRESFGKAVYIDKILPNTEAARLEREGKLKIGDEITMVSATFGNEMWSARGIGKYRLEKSIAVRQGMTISFVLENSDDNNKKARKAAAEKAQKEAARISRLQKQLSDEVDAEKKKGFFLW